MMSWLFNALRRTGLLHSDSNHRPAVSSISDRHATRPSHEQIVTAVKSGVEREARDALRAWGLRLDTVRLRKGPLWVIGDSFPSREQLLILEALRDLPALPDGIRLVFGRAERIRIAALELWEEERYDELRRWLSGVLTGYDPWAYLVWGRMLAREGREVEAGNYLLLSGVYEPDDAPFVERFKQTLQQAHPNQVVSTLPTPCRTRWYRARFPERVYRDLADLPAPAWLLRRPANPEHPWR